MSSISQEIYIVEFDAHQKTKTTFAWLLQVHTLNVILQGYKKPCWIMVPMTSVRSRAQG